MADTTADYALRRISEVRSTLNLLRTMHDEPFNRDLKDAVALLGTVEKLYRSRLHAPDHRGFTHDCPED